MGTLRERHDCRRATEDDAQRLLVEYAAADEHDVGREAEPSDADLRGLRRRPTIDRAEDRRDVDVQRRLPRVPRESLHGDFVFGLSRGASDLDDHDPFIGEQCDPDEAVREPRSGHVGLVPRSERSGEATPQGALRFDRRGEARDEERSPRDVGVDHDAVGRAQDLSERAVGHLLDRSLHARVDLHVANAFARERERPAEGRRDGSLPDVRVRAPRHKNVPHLPHRFLLRRVLLPMTLMAEGV